MPFTLDKAIYYSLVLFAFTAPLSVAGQSIFTTLAILLAVINGIKTRILPSLPTGIGIKSIFLFFGVLFLSAVFSYMPLKSFGMFWTYVARFLLFFVVIQYVRQRNQVETIFLAVAAGWIMTDVYAIIQWLHGNWRATGFYSHHMMFGNCLTMIVPLLLAQITNQRVSLRWLIFTAAFVLSVIALLANGSRGAWLAMLSIPIVLTAVDRSILKNRIFMLLMITTILIAILGIMYYPPIQARILSITDMSDFSNANRIWLWQSAYHLWSNSLVLGIGIGNYENYFNHYLDPRSEFFGKHMHAHSNFMQLLAETGIVGLIAFIFMFCQLSLHHYRVAVASNTDQWRKTTALGVLLLTVTLFIQGAVEYNMGAAVVARQFWFFTALAFAAYQVPHESNS